MSADYPLNSRVSVRITGFIASGLLGEVDGTRAIIRNREIAWNKLLPLSQYVGQTREAIVLGFNPAYQELELSLRLTERDPWPEAARKYAPGTIIDGRVVGLIRQGAFVKIETAVEGFLPVEELLPQPVEKIEDWLWIGDPVKALVTEVYPAQRRLRLSLRELLLKREADFQEGLWRHEWQADSVATPISVLLPSQVRTQLLQMEQPPEAYQEVAGLEVLVIEDDETYGSGLASLLRRNGCQVTWAKSARAGLAEINSKKDGHFDLILVDWGLPDLKGHLLIQTLKESGCPACLAMVLDPTPLLERPEIWQYLRDAGIDVFSKTDSENCRIGLVSLLRDLRSGQSRPDKVREPRFPRLMPSATERPSLPLSDGNVLPLSGRRQDIHTILSQLQRDTRTTIVTLLRFEPGRQHLLAEGFAGQRLPLEQVPPDLIHSPLADVLLKGEEVWERVSSDSPRFKRLLTLLSFQGFLGIPVPGPDSDRYGLFLVKQQGALSTQDHRQARDVAYLLAGILQERRLLQALQPWQAQNLDGQLASSVVHEVDNKLEGVSHHVHTLENGFRELSLRPEKAQDSSFLWELQQAVEKIAASQQEASRLRDQYLGLASSDEPQLVNVNVLTQDLVYLLRPEAQCHSIVLGCRLAGDLPPVKARPSELRQIFVNLTLNAIQQMAQLGRQGKVTIDISHRPEAPRPVQVRFIDEGPGIHDQHRERIFDFAFTTRKGGAGLGLTISRQIAANLGGELRLEESHVLWGTTFLLALPKGD